MFPGPADRVRGGLPALTVLAGLVFVGLLLGLMWLAHKLGHMEGERWEQYFRTISTAGLLARMALVMAASPGTGGRPQRPPVRPYGLRGGR